MAGKMLILRWGGSAYDSLGGLLELMAQEFANHGLHVVLFSADSPDWPARLLRLLQSGEFSMALTMSGIGMEVAVNNTLVWEATNVPLFNWSCDHPCYFPSRHVIANRFVMHGYVFPDHARYNIAHLKPNGTAFSVHLGIPPRSAFANAPLPLANRNGRIVLTKTGFDTDKIEARWRTQLSYLQNILFSAAEALFHRSTGDFLPVLSEIAERHGIFLDGNSHLAMMLLQELDAYIRFKRANLVMESVLRYPIDVFGSGWDHIAWDGAKARFYGPITWRPMMEQLPRYVGCLSINPLVDGSVHDRSFFALSAGVVPISDSNAFSRMHMPELEPYAFSFTRERIEQAVESVLAAPEDALARVETTWRRLEGPFGMTRAAYGIANLLRMHQTNAPTSPKSLQAGA